MIINKMLPKQLLTFPLDLVIITIVSLCLRDK